MRIGEGIVLESGAREASCNSFAGWYPFAVQAILPVWFTGYTFTGEANMKAAAIKLRSGEIFTGCCHAFAWDLCWQEALADNFWIEGFITDEGEFLTREQAFALTGLEPISEVLVT